MQVVILCGGHSARNREVSKDLCRPRVPLGARPMLWHIMNGFAEFGYRDFVLCLGSMSWSIKRYFLDAYHTRADSNGQFQVRDAMDGGSWRVTLSETGLNAGSGYRVKLIEKYITGENFLFTNGDGLADVNLEQLVAFHLGHGKTATVASVRPPARFAEMELDGQHVVAFSDMPCGARGWINGGYFVFHRRIFERLTFDPSLALEREPLLELAHDRELMAYQHVGFWHPQGSSCEQQHPCNDLRENVVPWKTWQAPRLRVPA